MYILFSKLEVKKVLMPPSVDTVRSSRNVRLNLFYKQSTDYFCFQKIPKNAPNTLSNSHLLVCKCIFPVCVFVFTSAEHPVCANRSSDGKTLGPPGSSQTFQEERVQTRRQWEKCLMTHWAGVDGRSDYGLLTAGSRRASVRRNTRPSVCPWFGFSDQSSEQLIRVRTGSNQRGK